MYSENMISFEVVLALILVLVSFCNCAKPAEDYLRYGLNPYPNELQWVAERIESGDWGKDVGAIASNLKLVQELAHEASRHGAESIKGKPDKFGISTYDEERIDDLELVLLYMSAFSSDSGLPNYNNGEVKTFIGFVDSEFGGISNFQTSLASYPPESLLFDYLSHYGKLYATKYMASMDELFDEQIQTLPPLIETQLDALISMGEKFSPEEADDRLAAIAEDMDLAKDKFNAKKMKSSVKQYTRELRGVRSSQLLSKFIVRTCNPLRTIVNLDMYNLARILVPAVSKLELSPKFRKLNEYSRICLPFVSGGDKEAAILNVDSNSSGQGILSFFTKN